MIVLLVVVPRYGAWFMVSTGSLMLLTNYIYWLFLPPEPLVAHVDGSILIFNFGWNYWLIFMTGNFFCQILKKQNWLRDMFFYFAGIGCMITGIVILVLDTIFPHSFSTILEVDFDTPYDRHVIIEESSVTKRREVKRITRMRNESFKDRIMRLVLYIHSRIINKIRPCNFSRQIKSLYLNGMVSKEWNT